MNTIGVDEHLAHLLLVQGGLLDAYLEQNLGRRYAYAITVTETDFPRRVRTVTNWQDPGPVRQVVQQLALSAAAESSAPIAVDRSPRFVDALLEGS
jgi:hypothetical protein